jgi:hypothetical protein
VFGQLEFKNLVVVVALNVERFSLFRENCQFRFLGVGSKNYLDSFSFLISHFENRLSFKNLKKNLVKRFSGLAVLPEL